MNEYNQKKENVMINITAFIMIVLLIAGLYKSFNYLHELNLLIEDNEKIIAQYK